MVTRVLKVINQCNHPAMNIDSYASAQNKIRAVAAERSAAQRSQPAAPARPSSSSSSFAPTRVNSKTPVVPTKRTALGSAAAAPQPSKSKEMADLVNAISGSPKTSSKNGELPPAQCGNLRCATRQLAPRSLMR